MTHNADAPQCRHEGGTDDCPTTCWLLYGEQFVRVGELGEARPNETWSYQPSPAEGAS